MKRVDSRVLTVRQPWADLIMAGVKDVENRTWPVPSTLPQWHECQDCDRRWMPGDTPPDLHLCREHPGNRALISPDGPFPFRLWIHAAKQIDRAAADGEAGIVWHTLGSELPWRYDTGQEVMPRGALLGRASLTRCHHADDCFGDTRLRVRGDNDPFGQPWYCSLWAELGVYHWTLTDPQPLDRPIPLKGRQGLWRLPEGVA